MCSENKGANQMYSYNSADLRLCFLICKNPVFFHGVTQIVNVTGNDIHFKRINSTHPYICCVYCTVCTCDFVPDI